VLQASDLACVRGGRQLFAALSFAVGPGQCLLVEGANGSGKTSLLRILAGLARPTAGTVSWAGRRVTPGQSEYLASLAYLGHRGGVKRELTALENLRFQAVLGGTVVNPDLEAILARIGLRGFEDQPVAALSAGQERRLAFARLLARRPPLWILDEPLTALDAGGVALLEGLLAEHIVAQGTVILTSHQPLTLTHSTDLPLLRVHLPTGEQRG
jgi:heme exporter protein A